MNNIVTFFREYRTGRILIPMGLILIVFGIFSFIAVNNSKDYIKTEAVVTKADLYEEASTDANEDPTPATYTVYVKYTVDGTEYNEEYGIFSGYKVGDKVTIAYNPTNPKQITQPNGFILPIVIEGLGIAALAYGVVSVANTRKKQKAMKEQEKGWSNND